MRARRARRVRPLSAGKQRAARYAPAPRGPGDHFPLRHLRFRSFSLRSDAFAGSTLRREEPESPARRSSVPDQTTSRSSRTIDLPRSRGGSDVQPDRVEPDVGSTQVRSSRSVANKPPPEVAAAPTNARQTWRHSEVVRQPTTRSSPPADRPLVLAASRSPRWMRVPCALAPRSSTRSASTRPASTRPASTRHRCTGPYRKPWRLESAQDFATDCELPSSPAPPERAPERASSRRAALRSGCAGPDRRDTAPAAPSLRRSPGPIPSALTGPVSSTLTRPIPSALADPRDTLPPVVDTP